MKKTMIALILALLLTASTALADISMGTEMEVTGCEDYITLREDADSDAGALARLPLGERVVYLSAEENGFACVGTDKGWGYVREKYLKPVDTAVKSVKTVKPTEKERYNINLFLSNFTEADFAQEKGCFNLADERAMVDFAIDHIWYNDNDKVEWFDGDDECNVRLFMMELPEVIEKYFGEETDRLEATWVELRDDGYFYWEETGGHVPSGFAQETGVTALGNGLYDVWFEIYGSGMDWDNDCCGYTIDEARDAYPTETAPSRGYARIHADDLSDRSTFTLKKYAFYRDWWRTTGY